MASVVQLKKKRANRERRKFRISKSVKGTAERPRLTVFRSDKYTYVQVVNDELSTTLVSAYSGEKEVLNRLQEVKTEGSVSSSTKSKVAAGIVGELLAERLKEKGLSSVVFDRNGSVYCGRVKELAEGARKGGLLF
jgi:large subunit ribosomal protein L18